MNTPISRRNMLTGASVVALTVAFGGFAFVTKQASAQYLRPPGIGSEEDFLSRCNRCQKCMQVCPYDIITPVSLDANIIGWGTPTLDFSLGFCDFCMDCIEVCPTDALRYGTETENNIGVAKIVKDACVAWDWAGCRVCVDECPVEEAIMLDDQDRPVVDETLCDGCGRCEEVCPSASLRAYDQLAQDKGIVVVSRQSRAAHISGSLLGLELENSRYEME